MQKVQTWRFRKTGLMQLISYWSVFCCTYLWLSVSFSHYYETLVPGTRAVKSNKIWQEPPAVSLSSVSLFAILRSNYFRLWQFLEFGFPGTALGDLNLSADLLTSVGWCEKLRIVNKLWYKKWNPVVTLSTFSWFCRKPIFDCRTLYWNCKTARVPLKRLPVASRD